MTDAVHHVADRPLGGWSEEDDDRNDEMLSSDEDPNVAALSDSEEIMRKKRMQQRRSSPKFRRRKRRSKLPVDPLWDESDGIFYSSSSSSLSSTCPSSSSFSVNANDIGRRCETFTKRLQRATDRFLDAAESLMTMKDEDEYCSTTSLTMGRRITSVTDLYADQSHPISNEIKDAIDDAMIRLGDYCYYQQYQHYEGMRMDWKAVGELTKTLLLAFLALPPLAEAFCQVASMLATLVIQQDDDKEQQHNDQVQQYCEPYENNGPWLWLCSDDHAVALYHNVLRYLEDKETLEILVEPMEIMFAGKKSLLLKLRFGKNRQLSVCRGTRMFHILMR